MVTLVFFKSIRQTDQRMQRVRNNFGAKQITDSPTDIEKSFEDTAKAVNDLENITFRRTNESDTSATADNSNDAEYAQK